MIKAFISHSSEQKPFVLNLVEALGRDYCLVDCYNFDSAYKTLDEIYRKIDQSTVFVLLLSKASLDSDWVKEEVRYSRRKLEPGCLDRFWPFIVDEALSIEDCPEWMRKDECFNLKKFKSYKVLAHDIEQKFRRIIWSKNPKRKQLETLMVGRNADIEKFEDIYQSARGLNLKALVVSGRDGVGKDMFISKCLDKIGGYSAEAAPYSINLGSKEGIENFIIQLNLITLAYNEAQLMDVLRGSTKQKVEAAAALANEILNTNSVISVNDDMACVLPTRQLADWLVEMVENSSLCNKLGIFIKSRKVLNSFSETHHPRIGHISLSPLDTKDRLKLFYSLLRIYNLTGINDDDARWFVEKLLHSPSQLVKAVEALAQRPLAMVKRDIDTLVSWGDTQISPMLRQFFGNEDSKYILIILSKLDIVSYSILEGFFGERIMEAMLEIDEMMDFGIVSVFGSHEQFFRLDHYLSDYIKRCHIQLPPDLESLLNEVLQNEIETSLDITEDVSVYLYEKKRLIMSGKGRREDFLIPSVVVNSVMEVYNRQEYAQVISLCDEVLNDMHNYFPDQERELRYWLCSALARIAHKRFNDEVRYFKGVELCFLRGFYHRNAKEYEKAERWLREALEKSPNLQRAKREMVTVLLAQKKFPEALEMARDNYYSSPENSYQIHGYFRSLVRKTPLSSDDKETLKRLMEEMKCNLSDKHEEMFVAMDIEYKDFVEHRSMKEMLSVIGDAQTRFPNSINIRRASQPFKLRHSLISKEEIYPEEG